MTYPPGGPGYPTSQQPTQQFSAPTQQFGKAEHSSQAQGPTQTAAGPSKLPFYLLAAVAVLGLLVYLFSFGPMFTDQQHRLPAAGQRQRHVAGSRTRRAHFASCRADRRSEPAAQAEDVRRRHRGGCRAGFPAGDRRDRATSLTASASAGRFTSSCCLLPAGRGRDRRPAARLRASSRRPRRSRSTTSSSSTASTVRRASTTASQASTRRTRAVRNSSAPATRRNTAATLADRRPVASRRSASRAARRRRRPVSRPTASRSRPAPRRTSHAQPSSSSDQSGNASS